MIDDHDSRLKEIYDDNLAAAWEDEDEDED